MKLMVWWFVSDVIRSWLPSFFSCLYWCGQNWHSSYLQSGLWEPFCNLIDIFLSFCVFLSTYVFHSVDWESATHKKPLNCSIGGRCVALSWLAQMAQLGSTLLFLSHGTFLPYDSLFLSSFPPVPANVKVICIISSKFLMRKNAVHFAEGLTTKIYIFTRTNWWLQYA
jgi:hypothetical protein